MNDWWKVIKISGSIYEGDMREILDKARNIYFERVVVPRNTGPGYDDILARLQDILILDNNLERRVMVLSQCANDAEPR